MKQEITNLEQNVFETITGKHMIAHGETVFVGVSGGADSVCLLYVLTALRRRLGITLKVIHVNHCLRKHAGSDERFVKQLAKKLRVSFVSGKIDVRAFAEKNKLSTEEAARCQRYEFFAAEAKRLKISTVAVGHTKNDQAETVLMRIIKGTGMRGLSAIRNVLRYKSISIIRPFISVTRAEIIDYLRANNISWQEDETNKELTFFRNRVRHKLLPFLKKHFNPNISEALLRLVASAESDYSFIRDAVTKQFEKCLKTKTRNKIIFDAEKIKTVSSSLHFHMIEKACEEIGSAGALDFEHWEVLKQMIRTRKKFELHLPKQVLVGLSYTDMIVTHHTPKRREFYYILTEHGPLSVPEAGISISITANRSKRTKNSEKDGRTECFDYDTLTFPLIVRNRKDGDRFIPLGMKGAKKVKDFLIEQKMPVYERNHVPLLFSGSELIWVMPLRISNAHKITSKTKKVVRISIRPLEN